MSKRQFLKASAGAAAAVVATSFASTAGAAGVGPVLAVISHPVKDYAAWRVVYDSFGPVRQKAGITGAEVFHDPKDPNLVVVVHRFPSLDTLQGFMNDPALKDAMAKAGVTAAPTAVVGVAA